MPCGSRTQIKIYSIINKVQSVLDIPLTVKNADGLVGSFLAVEKCARCWSCGCLCPAMHGRTQSKCIRVMRTWDPSQGCTSSDQDSIYRKRRYPYSSRCQTTDWRSRCWCGHDWSRCYGNLLSLQPNQPLLWNRWNPAWFDFWRQDEDRLRTLGNAWSISKVSTLPFVNSVASPLTTSVVPQVQPNSVAPSPKLASGWDWRTLQLKA